MTNILGLSCFYHDSAAALIVDGEIKSAAQEERFSRVKFDKRFPISAINYCLDSNHLKLNEIDAIVFYEKPKIKFERLMNNILSYSPQTYKKFQAAMPEWISGKLSMKSLIKKYLRLISPNFNGKILSTEHHQSHASSAFYPSPFKEAAIMVLDAVGEWASNSLYIGKEETLYPLYEQHFPHSLGMFYSAFTHYTGFKVNSGEYKMMGLAPYGSPKYYDKIMDNLIDLKEDGSFRLNLDYFSFHKSTGMTSQKFDYLFEGPPREKETKISRKDMDISASVQKVTEQIIIKIAKFLKSETSQKNLCMAGGVALNCVANGKLQKEKIFEDIWIQPASGDSGGAVGAALSAYYQYFMCKRKVFLSDSMKGSYLGPQYSNDKIKNALVQLGAKFESFDEKNIIKKTAEDIKSGKIIGWFHGKMEYGPRSLGARSILGDPRVPDMQKKMNLKIKFRESFRPFAPVILEEKMGEYFDIEKKSPYMLMVANVKSDICIKKKNSLDIKDSLERVNEIRSQIPSVTHVDFSARIQTVNSTSNPIFYKLLKEFESLTGCPLLINTSFNIRGEPIVCSPWDAFKCFMGTDIDILVIGNYYLKKESQNPDLKLEYKQIYDLD